MSKKSRLKKQKEKQVEMKKLADLEELEEIEAAKHRESKGAKKMRRRARRGYANVLMILFTILMLAAFLYSGFFYGGVTIVGAVGGAAEFIPKKTALIMGIGDCLMVIGIVLCFCKKYKVQAIFSLSGSLAYLYAGHKIILDIQQRMEEVYVEEELQNMDRDYMLYYYPILILTLFSLVLLIISIVKAIKKKRRDKHEADNAPVESIVS
ncbi:MAG: hypothetical protein LUI06_04675 [Ruminococcus sp.]|nr:hypothetical protein [Ruminococcus sp.]